MFDVCSHTFLGDDQYLMPQFAFSNCTSTSEYCLLKQTTNTTFIHWLIGYGKPVFIKRANEVQRIPGCSLLVLSQLEQSYSDSFCVPGVDGSLAG